MQILIIEISKVTVTQYTRQVRSYQVQNGRATSQCDIWPDTSLCAS